MDPKGAWRRSHRSIEITPRLEGREVTLLGWVESIREQKNITFIILRDQLGIVQLTLHHSRAPRSVLKAVQGLTEHSSVSARGLVKSILKAPHGAEVLLQDLVVLAKAKRRPPFSLFGGHLPRIEKRLDIRAIDLRRRRTQGLFRIRHTVLHSIWQFLVNEGFMAINTPKIIATATEGGASLFPLLYYDKEAFLAQSPQLYKEQMVLAFEKVFEIGPIFRAEKSRTPYHLSEVVSVDVEQAFADYRDIMALLEKLVHSVLDAVRKERGEELAELKINPPSIPRPFPRHSYKEVVDRLLKAGEEVSWGEDLPAKALKKLKEIESGFHFIYDWPTALKPFYIKPSEERPEVSESFDLMCGPVEVASGGSRIHSKPLLVKRLREQGLNPRLFEHHLKVFDYGMPPHAGLGLGLERLLMALTGQDNIREVAFYPRDQFRLVP